MSVHICLVPSRLLLDAQDQVRAAVVAGVLARFQTHGLLLPLLRQRLLLLFYRGTGTILMYKTICLVQSAQPSRAVNVQTLPSNQMRSPKAI